MTLPEVELVPSEENVSQDTTCYHVEQDEFAHKAKYGIGSTNSNFKAHFGVFSPRNEDSNHQLALF